MVYVHGDIVRQDGLPVGRVIASIAIHHDDGEAYIAYNGIDEDYLYAALSGLQAAIHEQIICRTAQNLDQPGT